MIANGWRLYYYRIFKAALGELELAVSRLAAIDPEGYKTHPKTRLLASVYRVITLCVKPGQGDRLCLVQRRKHVAQGRVEDRRVRGLQANVGARCRPERHRRASARGSRVNQGLAIHDAHAAGLDRSTPQLGWLAADASRGLAEIKRRPSRTCAAGTRAERTNPRRPRPTTQCWVPWPARGERGRPPRHRARYRPRRGSRRAG